ncbi:MULTISPECIES: GlxA family transcriptional regulator [Pseudonocardia]|uniref:HTH-type transcriptional regulator CdhR n=2 Tax=Pseudonocardia TaxID=1847 RepID=A0A1Y2MSJ4_PSEAH|nr:MULTISPECIES: helix-turn-helix domain-containing protein [Pseudonocardia]OSY38111.1 HTH-type transcriptional regulator CdhR [Pseudonocardia autotrophica]BBF99522.1 transcriptional regulator [Pseudonocardia autotrophica]GEC29263.1 transcriptional regulator [Pseudonocardia saturnea]
MPATPHRVGVLAVDGVITFELAIPERILGTTTGPGGAPLYDVRVGSVDGGPVRTSSGYRLLPEYGPEVLDGAQTLVVPAIAGPHAPGPAGGPELGPDQRVLDLLRRVSGRARIVAICTGAYTLAAAGLLDGRRATTHWAHAARLRRRCPQVQLDPDVLFVDDGDLLTSAGVAAGIDLCLHLVRRDHGAEVAAATARRNVVAPWREGGQAQFAENHTPEATGTDTAAVRRWAVEHLDRSPGVDELAARASMSVRTFTRRFHAETGTSPGRWLAARRLDRVRRLLESTDLPVEQIAARTGFGTTAALRHRLRAEIGMAPLAYRRAHRPPRAG